MIQRFGTAWLDPAEVAAVVSDGLQTNIIMKSGVSLNIGEQNCEAAGRMIREAQEQ